MDIKEIEKQNKALIKTSKLLFGDDAELRMVQPGSLSLLQENARYFKKESFQQLVKNVKNDKRLSSMPLCHVLKSGKLEVLSGNHRVQAAVQAEIELIMVMVIIGDLERDKQLAIQLSHNSLVGVDDPQILANLWSQIEDIKEKCYAGLSSDDLGELANIKMVSFSTPSIKSRHIVFAFSEDEAEEVEAVLTELMAIPVKEIYLAPMQQFDDFFNLIQQVKAKKDIKNGSLAILQMCELVTQSLAAEADEAEVA